MANDELSIWVLYRRPADYPNKYVGRRWMVMPKHGATNDILLADDLDSLRSQLPAGLTRLPRNPTDAPMIVESWI